MTGPAAAPAPPSSSGAVAGPPPGSPPAPPKEQPAWVAHVGGWVMLASGVVLAYGFYLLAQQVFDFAGYFASLSGPNHPSLDQSIGTFAGILDAISLAMIVSAVGVMLFGPGRSLMYLQKARAGAEFGGVGCYIAGRVLFAVAFIVVGGFTSSLAGSLSQASSTSSLPALPSFSLTGWPLEFIVLIIAGFVLTAVGNRLLKRPRVAERRIPSGDGYERASWGAWLGAVVLAVIGVLFLALLVYDTINAWGSAGSISTSGGIDRIGDALELFALSAIAYGVSDLLHAYAYARLPPEAPVLPAAAVPPATG